METLENILITETKRVASERAEKGMLASELSDDKYWLSIEQAIVNGVALRVAGENYIRESDGIPSRLHAPYCLSPEQIAAIIATVLRVSSVEDAKGKFLRFEIYDGETRRPDRNDICITATRLYSGIGTKDLKKILKWLRAACPVAAETSGV